MENTEPAATQPEPVSQTPCATKTHRLALVAALVIFLIGAIIRLTADAGFKGTGFDEVLYRQFVLMLDRVGVSGYPDITATYLEDQKDPKTIAKLPPTRFLYIYSGWIAKRVAFGDAPPLQNLKEPGAPERDPALVSLHRVSLTFSILFVGLVGLAGWRMAGPTVGLGAMALMAASPVAIHMSQHALIDGFFAFWATLFLWLLWENLQRPNSLGWLAGLGAALALMVMCKENAFFVFVALCGIIALNRWLKIGTVTPKLLFVGVLGPLVGLMTLITLAGGVGEFIEIYKSLVSKAQNLGYAIMTGDGPWYRYLIELMTSDPIVFVLALTGLATLPKQHKACRFLLVFVIISYAIMCNVRYGMNLRYTTVWALPITVYAAIQLLALARLAGRHSLIAAVGLFACVAAYDLRQYNTFFVQHPMYELVPDGMLRALKVIKDPVEGM